jgi:two-component system CheB/CheR fusion protein
VVVNVQSKPPESAPRSLQKSTDKFSLNRFAPPGVVVNGSLEVLEFRGKTSPFLLQPIGQPSTNLLKLINPEWLVVIKRIFNDVVKINRALKKEGLKLSSGKKSQRFDIEVVPINPLFDLNERIYLVSFISRPIIKKTVSRKDPPENQSRVRSLSRELTDLKNYQLDLSSQYEEAQEKLVTANELLQGINEELQSTNEEFETAKEELQSANEELITLNDELETRNFDLTVRSDDLDNLLDNTENPLLIVSKELLIRRFTPRAMLAFNLIATDVGRNIGDLKSNFGLNMSALIKDVMQNTKAKDIEVQGQDESWSRLQIRPYVTANNKVDGTIISLTDIEALKQKEKVTKDAYEYASSIAETVPLPLAVVDVKSHFKTMNRAFYEHFRLPKNAINQEIYSSLGIKSIQKIWLQKLFFVAIEQGIPFSDYEIASDVSHLGARKILVSGAKIHWKADESPALLLSFVDVTEQRTREEDRRQLLARERSARSEAEKANRTKDVFLATLSHELRTPLSSILAWAQLIRMDKIDAVKIKEGAAIIEQSAKAQSRLIDDLLDVSRISAGKITLELKEIDPLTPIKAAIESVRTQYEKNEISITTNFVKEKLLISGDSVRIQQIIWNLLTNAAKFSPSSGEVYVGLSHAQKQGQEYALIEVKDRGKGIPKEFLPHLFDRFSQADASSSRLHGGLGLGLSIVKSLVELHGGTVFVEDSQGECGAHFKILFPLLKADAAAEEVSQKIADSIVSQPRLDGIRILLVEDDIDSLQAISLLLQSLGAVVQEHSSAKHAVAALNQFRPDILVSDISMPEKDGFDLIRKIRALPHNEGGALPAIALTAHAALEDKSQTLEAGFQAHIAKPVEAEELGRVILNCLS